MNKESSIYPMLFASDDDRLNQTKQIDNLNIFGAHFSLLFYTGENDYFNQQKINFIETNINHLIRNWRELTRDHILK